MRRFRKLVYVFVHATVIFIVKWRLICCLLLFFRLESSFRSFSRPVLHAAARVVQEIGKSRAAAFALGLQDIDEGAYVNTYAEAEYHESDETAHPESNILLLSSACYA